MLIMLAGTANTKCVQTYYAARPEEDLVYQNVVLKVRRPPLCPGTSKYFSLFTPGTKDTVQWTWHTWLRPEKKHSRLYKSCFTCQRWRWCVTTQPPACCQSRPMCGGGPLRHQPEHLLVGVASATWKCFRLIRPYRLCVESYLSPLLLFQWESLKRASVESLMEK